MKFSLCKSTELYSARISCLLAPDGTDHLVTDGLLSLQASRATKIRDDNVVGGARGAVSSNDEEVASDSGAEDGLCIQGSGGSRGVSKV